MDVNLLFNWFVGIFVVIDWFVIDICRGIWKCISFKIYLFEFSMRNVYGDFIV